MADAGGGNYVCTFTSSLASTPEQLQREKQCLDIRGDRPAGLLRSHHAAIKWPGERGNPKRVAWVSAPPNDVKKHRRAKQRPGNSPFQEAGRKQKTARLGFIPKRLPTALFLPLESLGSFI